MHFAEHAHWQKGERNRTVHHKALVVERAGCNPASWPEAQNVSKRQNDAQRYPKPVRPVGQPEQRPASFSRRIAHARILPRRDEGGKASDRSVAGQGMAL